MKTVKVMVHVIGWNDSGSSAPSVRCEKVARFGAGGYLGEAVNPFTDEKVTVCYKLLCWQEGIILPSYTVPIETLRDGLERINLCEFKKTK